MVNRNIAFGDFSYYWIVNCMPTQTVFFDWLRPTQISRNLTLRSSELLLRRYMFTETKSLGTGTPKS